MGLFDYFVGKLHCPVCGAISPADSSTGMQTKLREVPNLDFLGEGSYLQVSQKLIEKADYVSFDTLYFDDEIRIIEMWTCPSCQSSNWARIIVTNNVISQIAAVCKHRQTLKEANLIELELLIEEAEKYGIDYTKLSQAELLQVLLKTV